MREANLATSLSQIDLQINSKTGSIVALEDKQPSYQFQQLSEAEKQVLHRPHE